MSARESSVSFVTVASGALMARTWFGIFRRATIVLSAVSMTLGATEAALAQADPAPYMTGYRYNAARALVGVISPDPDGAGEIKYAATRNTYNAAGQLVLQEVGELSTWQSEGVAPADWPEFNVSHSTATAYDPAARAVRETLAANGVVYAVKQFSYDAAGRQECAVIRMTPAQYGSLPASACSLGPAGAEGEDRITKKVYDLAGRIEKIQDNFLPGQQPRTYATYAYNKNGDRISIKDANGNLTSMTYNGHGRQTRLNFPSKTVAGQVSASDYEEYGYDANGNRTSIRKRDGATIVLEYDVLNRPWVKTPSSGRSVYFGYDLRGLQLYSRYDGHAGEGVTQTFDKAGRLTRSESNMGGVIRALGYEYDANGNRVSLSYPDGSLASFGYDGLGRMSSISAGGSSLVTFSYNKIGQRSGKTGGGATAYLYDPVARVASIDHDLPGGYADVKFSFSHYNAASQITDVVTSNSLYLSSMSVAGIRGYQSNGLNQYTEVGGVAFCYDANGNIKNDGSVAYDYDVENRLIRTRVSTSSDCSVANTGAEIASISYDPMGRLFQVTGQTTTRFVYDGDDLVAEYSGSGGLLRRYVHGSRTDEPVLWYESGEVAPRFLHADIRGSIIAMADSSGVSINTYDEFGVPAATNKGRFSYTGQVQVSEVGLSYYKARFYSPILGRFLQTDPVGYEDDLNLYAYVGNDPINHTDPDGMAKLKLSCKTPSCQREMMRRAGGDELARQYDDARKFHSDFVTGLIFSELPILRGLGMLRGPLGALFKREAGPLAKAVFAQKKFSPMFSAEGKFAGKTVKEVAEALSKKELKPRDVPIEYIERDGNILILNTRSAQALEQAGIPRSQWTAVNMTGNAEAEARLTAQLARNKLTNAGTPTVTQSNGNSQ